MEFIPPLLLTFLSFIFILIIFKKIEKLFFKKTNYRQSDIHNVIKKHFVLDNKINKKETQLSNRLDKNSVSVVILEDKAYWVDNNMFYNADFIDGILVSETIRPVDTNDLSKKEIDKMLFILDRLRDGNSNDSSSTG